MSSVEPYHVYAKHHGKTYYLLTDHDETNTRHFVAVFRRIYEKATIQVSRTPPRAHSWEKLKVPGFHEFFTEYCKNEFISQEFDMKVRRRRHAKTNV